MRKTLSLVILLSATFQTLYAQKDTLWFQKDNIITGEIKNLNNNILKIETDYSDDDFTIKWDDVKRIHTETYFLITLSNGTRYNGRFQSVEDNYVVIVLEDGSTTNVKRENIVMFDDIKNGFWKNLNASIDVGIELAKANNLRQFTVQSNAGYMARRWLLNGNYSILRSIQDDADPIKRTDGELTFRYFLPHDWYPMSSGEYLSNTEQQLKMRVTAKTGFGKYVLHTNQAYWGFSLGVNYNNEVYTTTNTDDRRSWEGFMGTEVNLFNVGDLDMMTQIIAYPSFTESKRFRSDVKINFKYDLPLDFYVKFSVTLNYDNQPVEGSSKADYVLDSGFGWEWKK